MSNAEQSNPKIIHPKGTRVYNVKSGTEGTVLGTRLNGTVDIRTDDHCTFVSVPVAPWKAL